MHTDWFFFCLPKLVPLAKCDYFPPLTYPLALLKSNLTNIISASSCALDFGAMQLSLKAVWEERCWNEALNLHGHKCPETLKRGLKPLVEDTKFCSPHIVISHSNDSFSRDRVSSHAILGNSVLSLHREESYLLLHHFMSLVFLSLLSRSCFQ